MKCNLKVFLTLTQDPTVPVSYQKTLHPFYMSKSMYSACHEDNYLFKTFVSCLVADPDDVIVISTGLSHIYITGTVLLLQLPFYITLS